MGLIIPIEYHHCAPQITHNALSTAHNGDLKNVAFVASFLSRFFLALRRAIFMKKYWRTIFGIFPSDKGRRI